MSLQKITIKKEHTYTGHRDCIYTLEQSAKSNLFFSGSGDGMIVLWNLSTPDRGELIAQMPRSVYALHYHTESDFLIAGHNHEGVHILNWRAKQEVASLNLTQAAIFDLKTNGNTLFAATGDGTLVVADLGTMRVTDRIRLSEKSARTIALCRSRSELAVGYSDCYIRVFDMHTLRLKHEWMAHKNSVFTLQYMPHNDFLMSGSRDARLKIWESTDQYNLVNEVAAHLFAINCMVPSPDGHHFITGSMDKSIKVWDASTQTLLKVIDKSRHAGHGHSVNKLLWTNYNNFVISAGDDRTISVWNVIFE